MTDHNDPMDDHRSLRARFTIRDHTGDRKPALGDLCRMKFPLIRDNPSATIVDMIGWIADALAFPPDEVDFRSCPSRKALSMYSWVIQSNENQTLFWTRYVAPLITAGNVEPVEPYPGDAGQEYKVAEEIGTFVSKLRENNARKTKNHGEEIHDPGRADT